MNRILFVHGFASSGSYKLADILRMQLRPCEVISPDFPVDPDDATAMLQDICRSTALDLVVGLSWGGFMVQKLRGVRKALINPDFHVSTFMRERIGEVRWLSPRADGEVSFNVDEELCRRYELLEYGQFEGLDEEERSLVTGFFASGDELVRCGEEFSLHYPGRAISYPGGHLPTYPQVKAHIAPVLSSLLTH